MVMCGKFVARFPEAQSVRVSGGRARDACRCQVASANRRSLALIRVR